MEIQISESLKDKYDTDDFLTALEISYINNHYIDSIEKKFNKLINIEIDPQIDVILIQYYLVILGGDYLNMGLLKELQNYNVKLDNNIKQLEENINNFTNNEKSEINERYNNILKIIDENKKKTGKLYTNILKSYKQNLSLSKTEEYSEKYFLYNLHQIQKESYEISKKNLSSDDHQKKINIYLDKMNDISDNFEENSQDIINPDENIDDNIYKKFIDSQISVLEQQLEMFK